MREKDGEKIRGERGERQVGGGGEGERGGKWGELVQRSEI
jgi:hypothetical protein